MVRQINLGDGTPTQREASAQWAENLAQSIKRKEHLAWCKRRALEYWEAGDLSSAVSSMVSDLNKYDGPNGYREGIYPMLAMVGLQRALAHDFEGVHHWITGYN